MQFLERAATDPVRFGTGLLYCTSFMAATAADLGLRTRARKLAAEAFKHWRSSEEAGQGDASSLVSRIQSYDAASRIGLRFPAVVNRLRSQARAHAPEEHFWFDPRREAPPKDVPEACACQAQSPRGKRKCLNCGQPLERMSATRVWFMCLTTCYCASKLGVRLGACYADVLEWLPHMRGGYRGSKHGLMPFYDSVYAATHVIYTLNDYGKYFLRPQWLPHEYEFLAKHLEHALQLNDPDMVGEFLDSLRAFGLGPEEPALRYAMQYLLDTQNRDGSWGAREGAIDYRRFHATWAAMDGLRDFTWKRPGLSFPAVLPRLKLWAQYT